MIFFVGLRTQYNDTTTYVYGFNNTNAGWSEIQNIDWSLGRYPGFSLLVIILRTIGVNAQMYLFLTSAFTIFIMMWFLRKYSHNLLFSTFVFITYGVFTFTMAAIKQCLAISFCLLAINFYLNKKRLLFFLFVLIAVLFHSYSIIFLVVPFLKFAPWTKKSILLLVAFIAVGFSLQFLFGAITEVTTSLGGNYSDKSFKGDGVNIFRVLVAWVPVILSFFVRDKIKQKNETVINLFINMAFVNAGLMFVGMFGNANYFARFANYFAIFQALAIPYIIDQFDELDAKNLKIFATIGYSLFFVYAHLINEQFDAEYRVASIVALFG